MPEGSFYLWFFIHYSATLGAFIVHILTHAENMTLVVVDAEEVLFQHSSYPEDYIS